MTEPTTAPAGDKSNHPSDVAPTGEGSQRTTHGVWLRVYFLGLVATIPALLVWGVLLGVLLPALSPSTSVPGIVQIVGTVLIATLGSQRAAGKARAATRALRAEMN